ncbi:hypothetical protein Bbelb_442620, partial [Branchiostoma belcheri]
VMMKRHGCLNRYINAQGRVIPTEDRRTFDDVISPCVLPSAPFLLLRKTQRAGQSDLTASSYFRGSTGTYSIVTIKPPPCNVHRRVVYSQPTRANAGRSRDDPKFKFMWIQVASSRPQSVTH